MFWSVWNDKCEGGFIMDNRKKIPKNKNVFDPQGSYTGRPADPMEKPVQDADDL